MTLHDVERYDGLAQDEKGISRGYVPDIAWFRDPAGNILAVLQETPAASALGWLAWNSRT